MPTIQVFDAALINGQVTSRSILLADTETRTFTGAVDFSANPVDPFLDHDFSYVLKMIAELNPEQPAIVGVAEFPSTVVVRTGMFRRVRLSLETSKLVTASLSISS